MNFYFFVCSEEWRNTSVFLFLVPYGCFPGPLLCPVATEGIPILFLLLAVGQLRRKCGIGVCNQVSPYLSTIGTSSVVLSLTVAMYCSNVIAWCLSTSSRGGNWNYYSIYYEDYRPLECGTMYPGIHLPVFWRKFFPPAAKPKGDISLSVLILTHAITLKNCWYYQDVVTPNSNT